MAARLALECVHPQQTAVLDEKKLLPRVPVLLPGSPLRRSNVLLKVRSRILQVPLRTCSPPAPGWGSSSQADRKHPVTSGGKMEADPFPDSRDDTVTNPPNTAPKEARGTAKKLQSELSLVTRREEDAFLPYSGRTSVLEKQTHR